jgi:basic membrane protein A
MKKILALLAMLALLLTACGGKKEEAKATEPAKAEATADTGKKLQVGIVLSIGGLGDKSFNDSAYRGLEMAQKDLGIEFKAVEPASTSEDEENLRKFAEKGFDLVIGTGFLMKDALEKVAKDYPDVKFALIDETSTLPNVSSLVFSEDEGSFLVGALAAMMSKTGSVGFVGGMESPLIRKFQTGYKNGAKYVNKDIKVGVLYTSGNNPFNDPVRGKENALSLIKQGADVVYHAAGGTGIGVIEAAKEAKVYAIGVDGNQDGLAQGTVLTSMLKNVDTAVYQTIKDVQAGTFKGGEHRFGLVDNGVGITDLQYTKDVIGAEKIAKLEEIKKGIVEGKISVK